MSVHVCPRIGTNVIVGHLGTGIERGVVLGTTPTQNGGAVIPDHINTAAILFDDGMQVSHNPETGATQLIGSKTVLFVAGGDIALHSDGVQTIHCSGKFNATSGADTNMSAGGNTVISASNVTIIGGTITLQGNVHITGDLTVDGTTYMKQAIADPNCQNTDGSGGGT
jgi:phage baseplate assembly protein gpV